MTAKSSRPEIKATPISKAHSKPSVKNVETKLAKTKSVNSFFESKAANKTTTTLPSELTSTEAKPESKEPGPSSRLMGKSSLQQERPKKVPVVASKESMEQAKSIQSLFDEPEQPIKVLLCNQAEQDRLKFFRVGL
jgi:hypothetical protein